MCFRLPVSNARLNTSLTSSGNVNLTPLTARASQLPNNSHSGRELRPNSFAGINRVNRIVFRLEFPISVLTKRVRHCVALSVGVPHLAILKYPHKFITN